MIEQSNLEWLARAQYWFSPETASSNQIASMKILNDAIVEAREVWNRQEQEPPFADDPDEWQGIDWNDNNASISQYFRVYEATKNGDRMPGGEAIKKNIWALAQAMDSLRKKWGSGWTVTSWYRPPAVNAAVGGAANSQHLYGLAADVAPLNGDVYGLQKFLDREWPHALGYGAARGFVHLDLRPGRIRWNY